MVKPSPSLVSCKKPNLICNFRAPNAVLFKRWKEYVSWCQDNGKDVCHTTIALIDGFLASLEQAKSSQTQIAGTQQIVNVSQSNTFLYEVVKPRREPFYLNCAKDEYQRTISSRMVEAYVMDKARGLKRNFSFLDFAELKHESFRKIILRLKRKGLMIAIPFRSNPRYYCLAERLHEKRNASENC